MKRVKVMLSAIAVVAVVGGALAFKAKNSIIYCADLAHFGAQAGTPTCTTFDNSTYVVANPVNSYCTTNILSTCTVPVKEIKFKQ